MSLDTLEIRTYKNNRVFGTILKELKKYEEYKVKEIHKERGSKELKTYEIKLPFYDQYSLNRFTFLLKGMIESLFENNYHFDYCSTGLTPLGFTASFIVTNKTGQYLKVSHRIKEVKK